MAARSSCSPAARAGDAPDAEPAAGDAGRRALQPHGPAARAQRPGEGRAEHRGEVPRRDAAGRLQRHRRDSRHRQGRRDRAHRRALRLVAWRDGRDRQRRRLGGDDGSAAHPQGDRPASRAAPFASGSGAPKRTASIGSRRIYRAGTHPAATAAAGADSPALQDRKTRACKTSAYFNLDNGTGKIRGVWMQGNDAVRPDLRSLDQAAEGPRRRDPRAAIGRVRPITPTSTRSACRRSSSSRNATSTTRGRITRTWTSYDRVQADDMKQMATVAAVFVWQAANRAAAAAAKAVMPLRVSSSCSRIGCHRRAR